MTIDNRDSGRSRIAKSIAERIAARLEETGKSAAAVSRAAGKGQDFIRDFLSARKSTMSADAMAKIARELGVTVAWLQGDDDALPEAPDGNGNGNGHAPRTVPVFGSISGAAEGVMHVSTEIVEMLPCPHGLAGVRDVYALFVNISAMEPRFRQGEVVFVTPHRPPRPGDDVVLTLKNESGGTDTRIKQYTGDRTGQVCTIQHNPHREIFFDRDKVLEIHRIAPINDLVGV